MTHINLLSPLALRSLQFNSVGLLVGIPLKHFDIFSSSLRAAIGLYCFLIFCRFPSSDTISKLFFFDVPRRCLGVTFSIFLRQEKGPLSLRRKLSFAGNKRRFPVNQLRRSRAYGKEGSSISSITLHIICEMIFKELCRSIHRWARSTGLLVLSGAAIGYIDWLTIFAKVILSRCLAG